MPDGTVHPSIWVSPTAGAVVDVRTDVDPAAGGLRTANNYVDILDGSIWRPRTDFPTAQPFGFQGHFDAPPNSALNSAMAPGLPGDHLMGLLVDGTTSAGVLTVNFSGGLSNLGFRLAANELSIFDATIRIFSGLNGTGSQIDQLNLRDLAGGGLCTSLSASSNSNLVPSPCNDAPFLGFLDAGGIRSLTVGTSDTRGFYIGNLLYANTPVPEPASFLLCGLGAAALIVAQRRRRRS